MRFNTQLILRPLRISVKASASGRGGEAGSCALAISVIRGAPAPPANSLGLSSHNTIFHYLCMLFYSHLLSWKILIMKNFSFVLQLFLFLLKDV